VDTETLRRDAERPVIAGQAEAGEVAADLSDAFADDVMFDWFLRADACRDAARLGFFRFLISRMAVGQGTIERPACGGAAAVWLPFEAVGPTPLSLLLLAAPTLIAATGWRRIGRLIALMEDLDRHHPTDRPHAYLWFLGVARAAQGRGVGSRLLKVATDRLDAQGCAAYLETQSERNVGLYRRHGFEVISEHKPRPDAPRLWSMWREPLRASRPDD
jgi:ribosomal protein S18 acetylase RimI-like enzyme